MARRRGISRRGSSSGARGGVRGRGGSGPRRISPLDSISPASPSSDHSDLSLNSSFHSSCFKFKSRLNKPIISAIITVIFSEEEDVLTGSVETSKDRSLSHNSRDSQGSMAGDVLNNPTTLQAEGHQEDSCYQQASSHKDIIACAPAQFSGSILHLVTPPGCNKMEVEENVMVHWVSSPCSLSGYGF